MENNEKLETVQNLKKSLLQERNDLIENIKKNNDIIISLQNELCELNENIEDDLKFFSPISNNDEQKKLIQIRKEINELLIKNDSYQEKINLLEQNIEALVSVDEIDKENQNSLSQIVINLNEMDRKRIARELHDTTIQNMVCLIHKVELASKYIDMDPIRAKLELTSTIKYVRETIDEIRAMVYDLRPMSFDDLGFVVLLQQYLDELNNLYSNEIEYRIDATFDGITEDNLLTIYRIIKECCMNSIKHSSGGKLTVCISDIDNCLTILISDDGRGCNLEKEIDKHHYGLQILKDRVALLNGILNIVSEPDKGYSTKISFNKSRLMK